MEIEGQESFFIEFSPEVISQDGEEVSIGIEEIQSSFLLVIIVNSISHRVLSKENRRFTISSI
jgi:hypothetical protein